MTKWIRTSRLSITNSLCEDRAHHHHRLPPATPTWFSVVQPSTVRGTNVYCTRYTRNNSWYKTVVAARPTNPLPAGLALLPPVHHHHRLPEREFFIDNLLVRIHFIIVMIRWTGLAPWEFGFPLPPATPSCEDRVETGSYCEAQRLWYHSA